MFLKAYPAQLRPFAFKMLSYQFIGAIVFFHPIYMLYLADLGFAPVVATGLLSLWYCSSFVFELPSSIWADRVSRKTLLIVAEISSAIGYTCFWLFPTVWGAAIGFVIWGLRGALLSGTIEAYLYDELKYAEQSSFFVKLQGHRAAFTWAGTFVAALGVWFYQELGIGWVIILSVLSRVLAAMIITTWPEDAKSMVQKEKTSNLTTHMLAAKDVLRKDLWLVIVMLLTACMTNITVIRNIATAIGDELHMTAWQGTWGMMLISAAFVLGSLLGGYLRFSKLRYFLWFALLPCLLIVLSSFVNNALGYFALISVAFFVYQFWAVHSMAQRQERVPSHLRATVISVGGMFDRGMTILGTNLLGFIATKTSYHYAAQSLVWPALAVLGGVGIYGVWVSLRDIKT